MFRSQDNKVFTIKEIATQKIFEQLPNIYWEWHYNLRNKINMSGYNEAHKAISQI